MAINGDEWADNGCSLGTNANLLFHKPPHFQPFYLACIFRMSSNDDGPQSPGTVGTEDEGVAGSGGGSNEDRARPTKKRKKDKSSRVRGGRMTPQKKSG